MCFQLSECWTTWTFVMGCFVLEDSRNVAVTFQRLRPKTRSSGQLPVRFSAHLCAFAPVKPTARKVADVRGGWVAQAGWLPLSGCRGVVFLISGTGCPVPRPSVRPPVLQAETYQFPSPGAAVALGAPPALTPRRSCHYARFFTLRRLGPPGRPVSGGRGPPGRR